MTCCRATVAFYPAHCKAGLVKALKVVVVVVVEHPSSTTSNSSQPKGQKFWSPGIVLGRHL